MTSLGDDLKTIIDADYNASPPTQTCYVYQTSRGANRWLETPWNNTTYFAADKLVILILTYLDEGRKHTVGSKFFTGMGMMAVWGVSEANVDAGMVELKQVADNYTTGPGFLSFTYPTIIDFTGKSNVWVSYPRFTLRRVRANT